MSAAAKEAAYAEHVRTELERLKSMHPGAVAPDVDRVRYVSPGDWSFALAECLSGEGFKTVAQVDGGIRPEVVPPEQSEAQAIAVFTCSVRYPIDPQHTVPLDDAQLNYLYDYLVNDLVPCLEEAGYEISASPSRQAYKETFRSDPWSPYSDVSPLDEYDWIAINDACPQRPDHLFGPGQ